MSILTKPLVLHLLSLIPRQVDIFLQKPYKYILTQIQVCSDRLNTKYAKMRTAV